MIRKVLLNEKGMLNLTELVIVMSIMTMVIGATFNALYFGEKQWSRSSVEADARQNARFAMIKMTKEIRQAQSPSDTEYGVYKADKLEFQFYADISDTAGPERIHYYMSANQLVRGELASSASEAPWQYNGIEQTKTIAQCIRNTSDSRLFRYYDGNGTELTNVPLSEADRKSIRLVSIDLLVDVDPGVLPDAFALGSQVDLRNLRE